MLIVTASDSLKPTSVFGVEMETVGRTESLRLSAEFGQFGSFSAEHATCAETDRVV